MARLILISLLIISTFSLGGCTDNSEKTTEGDVLESFDRNSDRPGNEEEYQEDSAVITGTPIDTVDN